MESLIHATSGAAGGILAMSLLYPLDQVRMIKQTEEGHAGEGTVAAVRRLVRERGWPALYQGINSVLVSMGVSNFVYFYAFNGLKAARLAKAGGGGKALAPADNLQVACAAGVINVLATAPLWVANTRIKTDSAGKYPGGFADTIRRIAADEGVPALWKGTLASLMLVSNPVIQFGVYEAVKGRLLGARGRAVSGLQAFALGAWAKAWATVFTYPLQLAQSQLRATRAQGERAYSSTADCLRSEYRKGGLRAWFAGMEAKMLQTVLNSAFMFLFYEKIAAAIFKAARAARLVQSSS